MGGRERGYKSVPALVVELKHAAVCEGVERCRQGYTGMTERCGHATLGSMDAGYKTPVLWAYCSGCDHPRGPHDVRQNGRRLVRMLTHGSLRLGTVLVQVENTAQLNRLRR